jgi:hypothetical protein
MTAKLDGTNGLIQQYDYQTPTTGFSYTFTGANVLVMNPAGTLATGTITMPAVPADGMTITFSSTKLISALTLNGNTGQTVVSAVTVLPANQATTYVYRLSNTSWYPMTTVATNTLTSPTLTNPTLTNPTLTSPTITGAVVSSMASSVITQGASVTCAGQTVIDFASLPSWVKRITVMFNAVSTSGTSVQIIQLGTGATPTYTTSGYSSGAGQANGVSSGLISAGFAITTTNAASTAYSGSIIITNLSGNTWVASGAGFSTATVATFAGGGIALGAALTAVRITTVNGTDTFDTTPSAGTINILYE